MKKGIILTVSLAAVAALLSLVVFASAPKASVVSQPEPKSENKVITTAESENRGADANKVLEARFLNMLNRNFVYNGSFDTVEAIVNDSVIALLEFKDSEDDSFISESVVSDFVYNMYGIEIEDFSDINADCLKKDGYVFILPRGYEIYSHEISNVTENEDGSYTVKTVVTVSSHDGITVTENCETLFVKNEASQFGFSIIYSNIGAAAATI